MMYPKINVEKLLAEVVRDYGGVVLEDTLPKSPNFENADYVFHFEKIVAELKCLTEDNVDSPNNQTKVNELVTQGHHKGKIKTTKIDQSNWRELPKELQTKIYEITTRSIQKRIQKANVQIRETKRELRLDDYNGLLFLANDGIASLPPAAFLYATHQALRNYSEIKYFIYLTANLFTQLRETPMPTLFWIGFDMQKGPKMNVKFTDRLGMSWRRLVCRKTGMPGFEQEMHDIEGFWRARHLT